MRQESKNFAIEQNGLIFTSRGKRGTSMGKILRQTSRTRAGVSVQASRFELKDL